MGAYKNHRGEAMFTMEKMPDGRVLLNEYTEDGIITHEFGGMLDLEIWVIKRGIVFH